uniref:glutathione transferase n=1 Tax=Caenorhabditis tropicalis TaxID=1561998 RepID=A0A1I7TDA8_9PELO
MVHYKLTYFNARGLAEISRQLFHLAGVEFEDHRLTEEEFAALKPNLPTGQVPILYIDNVPFSQSTAFARYLARKFGEYEQILFE